MAADLDHVILLVADLPRSVLAFRRAGFEVRSGGRFPPEVPFHNALVAFEDDLYIELLGIRRRQDRLVARTMHRLGLWAPRFRARSLAERRIFSLVGEGIGFVDLCVRVPELDVARLQRVGGCRWETVTMRRSTMTGQIAAWQLAFPEEPRLPFVICDQTPRRIRIPAPVLHPNGVRRMEAIDLLIHNAGELAPVYGALFGCSSADGIVSERVRLVLREAGRQRDGRALTPEVTLSVPSSWSAGLDALLTRYPGLRISS